MKIIPRGLESKMCVFTRGEEEGQIILFQNTAKIRAFHPSLPIQTGTKTQKHKDIDCQVRVGWDSRIF